MPFQHPQAAELANAAATGQFSTPCWRERNLEVDFIVKLAASADEHQG